MKKSRKIFLGFCLLFFFILVYIGYDISSRTTFPGRNTSESDRVDSLDQPIAPQDSIEFR